MKPPTFNFEEHATTKGESAQAKAAALRPFLDAFEAAFAANPLCSTLTCTRRAAVLRNGKVFCHVCVARTPLERRKALLEEKR